MIRLDALVILTGLWSEVWSGSLQTETRISSEMSSPDPVTLCTKVQVPTTPAGLRGGRRQHFDWTR